LYSVKKSVFPVFYSPDRKTVPCRSISQLFISAKNRSSNKDSTNSTQPPNFSLKIKNKALIYNLLRQTIHSRRLISSQHDKTLRTASFNVERFMRLNRKFLEQHINFCSRVIHRWFLVIKIKVSNIFNSDD